MSGGNWDYVQGRIQNDLETVANEDPAVMERWPRLRRALLSLSVSLYTLIKDMDWDLSGDSYIKDDETWEANALSILASAIEKSKTNYT